MILVSLVIFKLIMKLNIVDISRNKNCLLFDFDGVILDSNHVKTNSFKKLFLSMGKKKVDNFINFHIENQGMSRYEKFKYFYKNILFKNISNNELDSLSEKFTKIIFQEIIKCDFIPGIKRFLLNEHIKYKNKFIVSATPQYEIRMIIKKLKIDDMFNECFGSPKNKIEILNDLFQQYNFKSEECLFYGDSINDYYASKHHKIEFVSIGKNIKDCDYFFRDFSF